MIWKSKTHEKHSISQKYQWSRLTGFVIISNALFFKGAIHDPPVGVWFGKNHCMGKGIRSLKLKKRGVHSHNHLLDIFQAIIRMLVHSGYHATSFRTIAKLFSQSRNHFPFHVSRRHLYTLMGAFLYMALQTLSLLGPVDPVGIIFVRFSSPFRIHSE